MLPVEADQALREAEQALVLLDLLPVEPACIVVLAVGVVVPTLRTSDLIAEQEHGCSLRNQKDSQRVLDLPLAQTLYVWIVRWPFVPAVRAVVLVGAVSIVFSVVLVVFLAV